VSGRFIAKVDFAWPEHWFALEYDGIWHGDPDQFPKDRRRLNRLGGVDWRVHFATKEEMRRPRELLADVARALSV